MKKKLFALTILSLVTFIQFGFATKVNDISLNRVIFYNPNTTR